MNFPLLSHVFLTNLSFLQVFSRFIYSFTHFFLFLSHLNVFGYAGFSDLEDFWDDLPVSRLEVVWKSSGLLGSLLTKSSGLPVNGIQACLCRRMIYNSFVCGLFCELHVYSFSCEFFVKSVIMFIK
ncbi:unnamed protein product, partial [Brassica napus]